MNTSPRTTFVVRVPAFPADGVDALRSPRAADWLRRCRDAAEETRLQAARCSDILYDVVAALPVGRDRSALLDLRRSVHNGRAARARRLVGKLAPLLTPAAERALDRWDRLVADAERIRRSATEVWDGELDRSGAAAVETASRPAITLELARSTSPLTAALDRAMTAIGHGAAPDLDTALSAYAFVVRACMKTTPRGSLSAWAHGVLTDGPDRWDGDPRPREHHAELNAFISLTLLRQLVPPGRLVANPSTVDTDGALYAITPNCDAVRRIRADSALRELIATWPPEGRTMTDATRALAAVARPDPRRADSHRADSHRADSHRADPNRPDPHQPTPHQPAPAPSATEQTLARLVDIGLLVGADETPLQDPDPLRAAARRPDVTEEAAAILIEVADAADALTRTDAAAAAVPELASTLNSLSARLSWPAGALRHGAPAYADTVLTTGKLALDAAEWAPLWTSLRAVAGWIGHADPWAATRARAEAHLEAVFGAHRPIPLTVALHALVRAADCGVPGIEELWSDEFRLPPADDPGLAGLRELMAATPTVDGVLRIDPLPPAPARPDSLTTRLAFYGHPVRLDGRPRFVVNSVEDGCGRADAHVQRILDRIGLDDEQRRAWPDNRPTPLADTVDVEIAAVADSNVNLRVLGALPELTVSQGLSTRGRSAAGARIDARECHVVAGEGRLVLAHGGRRLRVVPRGRMADFHYPAVLRLLLRMFGPSPEHRVQPVIAPEGHLTEAGCRLVPRVDLGGVILMRRTVIVESDQVPRRGAGETLLSYAERVDAWRRGCAIPAWSFVRAVNAAGADKHRKPMPIDLTSPLGVAQIERTTHREARRLLFQEVLPDAAHAPVAEDGSRWFAEAVWEVDI
ncbi:hypothetical protein ABZ791_03565 [Streptomyces huasconensis]|uniref:Lantibiotic dehydratase N-terminal domain-containing protein n=1 Tax=Streptomyces huasconensis TaxID=1854574 RepID=A0ABV3LZF8_9ACTN